MIFFHPSYTPTCKVVPVLPAEWYFLLIFSALKVNLSPIRKQPQGCDPSFLEKYSDLIGIIVDYYSRSYRLPEEDAKDLSQDLAEFLLIHTDHLEKKTKGLACQRGYLYITLLRHCSHILKRRRKPAFCLHPGDAKLHLIPDGNLNPEVLTILRDLIHKLKDYMKTFGPQRPLVELQIKLHYKIPLTVQDLRICFPDANPDSLHSILSENLNINLLPEGKANEVLHPFFSAIETKTKHQGSRIRNNYNIWKEIRKVLGFTLNVKLEDEALGYLFERYFLQK